MSIEITYCEQNSPAWLEARLGIVTASEFSTVMAKGRSKGEPSKTRTAYMRRLADENIYGKVSDYLYTNGNMDRGHVMEPEARSIYALTHDVELLRVGFVYNSTLCAGCSPDSLAGDKGALEVKTDYPHILIGHELADVFPIEHKPQCQGILWVCEREWIDLMIYWPERDPFIRRAYRDEEYIEKTLSPEVERFNGELADMIVRLQQRRRAA